MRFSLPSFVKRQKLKAEQLQELTKHVRRNSPLDQDGIQSTPDGWFKTPSTPARSGRNKQTAITFKSGFELYDAYSRHFKIRGDQKDDMVWLDGFPVPRVASATSILFDEAYDATNATGDALAIFIKITLSDNNWSLEVADDEFPEGSATVLIKPLWFIPLSTEPELINLQTPASGIGSGPPFISIEGAIDLRHSEIIISSGVPTYSAYTGSSDVVVATTETIVLQETVGNTATSIYDDTNISSGTVDILKAGTYVVSFAGQMISGQPSILPATVSAFFRSYRNNNGAGWVELRRVTSQKYVSDVAFVSPGPVTPFAGESLIEVTYGELPVSIKLTGVSTVSPPSATTTSNVNNCELLIKKVA